MILSEIKGVFYFLLIPFVLLLLIGVVQANPVHVANSHDWKDAYSVMLHASLEGNERSYALSSHSVERLTDGVSSEDTVKIYQSATPYVEELEQELKRRGYPVGHVTESSNLNLELDPKTGSYFVISSENPRLTPSLAPLALQRKGWVLFVNETNAQAVSSRLETANEVIAVGEFKRDVLKHISHSFTDRINTGMVYADSQELAERFGTDSTIMLSDGSYLESDYFTDKMPVLITGREKMSDSTFSFLNSMSIDSVVVVGMPHATIGNQVRRASDGTIRVLVKFGESDKENSGVVNSLSLFPLPSSRISLVVTDALYDHTDDELVVTYHNTGSTGTYVFSTISINQDDSEIGSVSDKDSQFLAPGERLSVRYNITLPPQSLVRESNAVFYTSYGHYKTHLDSQLTANNSAEQPFSIPLTIKNFTQDTTQVQIEDIVYRTDKEEVKITLYNNGSEDANASVTIKDVIINGLEKTLNEKTTVKSGRKEVINIPASLDRIDLKENDRFSLRVTYGASDNMMSKRIEQQYPFKTHSIEIHLFAGIIGSVLIILLLLTYHRDVGLLSVRTVHYKTVTSRLEYAREVSPKHTSGNARKDNSLNTAARSLKKRTQKEAKQNTSAKKSTKNRTSKKQAAKKTTKTKATKKSTTRKKATKKASARKTATKRSTRLNTTGRLQGGSGRPPKKSIATQKRTTKKKTSTKRTSKKTAVKSRPKTKASKKRNR
ncbi:MAG: hypothetical protein ACLFNB_02555 [Candidatus Woesearchaeota archaeon]